MGLLLLGLALWNGAHFFKRFAPQTRARLGEPGKGLVSVLLVGSIVLIVMGNRRVDFIPVWDPPAYLTHVNNLLMVLAFWVYGSSAAKNARAWPANKTRHPQLLGFKIWAIAHLLVNGDLASMLLFGVLLSWAVLTVIAINRAEPDWIPPAPAGAATYARLAIITAALTGLVAAIHIWLGVWPFPF
ncbi:MAG: NnrU family protein [Pseudomonadota bacterium]